MPLLQPPSVPTPPPPPGSLPVGVQSGVTEIPLGLKPLSSADVDALKAKRNELSRQLTSVQSRRDDVAKE